MSSSNIIENLFSIIENRKSAPAEKSYVASLLQKGLDAILSKVTEESDEVCAAARENDKNHLTHEICDLLFHTFVLAGYSNISYDEIEMELQRRFGTSGHTEKAQRQLKT